MLDSVAVVAAIATVPAALGAGLDRFLLDRDKGRIHRLLLSLWNWLDDHSIPDLASMIARACLDGINRLTGGRGHPLRAFAVGLAASVALTSLAVSGGLALAKGNVELPSLGFVATQLFTKLVPVNFLFDSATVLVSYRILQLIGARRSPLSFSALLLGLIGTFALAIGSAWVARWLTGDFSSGESLRDTLRETFSDLAYALKPRAAQGGELVVVFYAFTTLIPTATLLAAITISMMGKAIVSAGRRFALYFLERATQVARPKDMIVFTLAGFLFSSVAISAKCILAIAKVVWAK